MPFYYGQKPRKNTLFVLKTELVVLVAFVALDNVGVHSSAHRLTDKPNGQETLRQRCQ